MSYRESTEDTSRPKHTNVLRKGVKVCVTYGENFEKLMKNMQGLHSELARWIIEDGYRKVLARPGLTLLERELIAVRILAAGAG